MRADMLAKRVILIVRSAEPGEDWSWCFVDELAFLVEPTTAAADAFEGDAKP